MKKTLSIILAILMIVTMVPVSAFAATEAIEFNGGHFDYSDKLTMYYQYDNYLYSATFTNLKNISAVGLYFDSYNQFRLTYDRTTDGVSYNVKLYKEKNVYAYIGDLPKSVGSSLSCLTTYDEIYIKKDKPVVIITCLETNTPTWTWNGTSSATAKLSSTNGAAFVNAPAKISKETVAEATTCKIKEQIKYTASVTFNGKTYTNTKTVTGATGPHDWSNLDGICANGCGTVCDHAGQTDKACAICGADITAIATVTDGTNTYYAADAATLNQAVTAILEIGSRTFTVELPADTEAGMITTIRRAICDTEGVDDGSINLTLKGVTTIPGTTNWDGVAFGPGDIYDEAGEIVDQELVTQLASVNLPDVTEIGAQAFYFCENLVTVSAPKAQTIGAQALGYTALTSVEFPELTTIPTDMFSGTWTLSSAKFPKVTTIEQGGLLVGEKFMPENNPTPFPLELTAEGDITFNGSNHFNIKSQNYSGKVDLVLNIDKKDQVTFNDDGTATWQVRDELSYTFKSITFTCTDGTTNHSYTYTDNGDGTHDATCTACGAVVDNDAHAIENHVCTACGAMEIVVSFDAGDYEWKTGDTLYFCRVSGDNEWEEYAFTATVAGDGTVTWTPDRTLYWDGTGEHKLVIYPDTGYVWDTWYVDEDQATPETLRKNDRLDAIWSGNPTTDTITFNLKHRMAKVTVNYEAAEGVTISKAEVYTLTQYVFFDEDTLERINIAWEEGHDLWINSYHNGNQFTAFVSPDAYAADGNFIKITLSDGSVYEVKMNKAVTFEDGGEYTYKVVITADGAALKADYTYIDEVIKKIEEKFADENLTDEAKAGLEEIKADLEEMKNNPLSSKADLAELEKALEDYEAEVDAGIADGTMIKADFTYMTSLFDEINALIDNDPNKLIPSESGRFQGIYYGYYMSCKNDGNHSQADYDENMAGNNWEGQIEAILAGIKDGSALKADYTAIDEAIAKLDEKLADENLTDEAKAGLEEIKADLEEMKNNPLSSKADLAELEKALEDYETELDAGIEDGTAVEVNGMEILLEYQDELRENLIKKYGEENYNNLMNSTTDEVKEKAIAIEEAAEALTGTVAENAEKIAEIKASFKALFDEAELCLAGTHSYTYEEISPAKCGENAIEEGTCWFCGEVLTREVENSALTHSFTKYEETEAPKCGVAGKEVAYCDNGCGEADEKEIAALTHSFSEYVYNEDATCTADGTKTAVCDNGCGETDTVTAEDTMLDHADEDGDKICDDCEADLNDTCPDCGGPVHTSELGVYICILVTLIKLIVSLMETLNIL